MDFSESVLYLTISVRITFCTSCPYDEFFLLSRIVHSGKVNHCVPTVMHTSLRGPLVCADLFSEFFFTPRSEALSRVLVRQCKEWNYILLAPSTTHDYPFRILWTSVQP